MADLIRDIDTIVIVLMENRSFDHILGYLGLPPFNWAIEGQQKCNDPRYANPYQGQSYLPFHMSRLDMPDDPPHERPWIANQIGDIINGQRNMTGFVQSYYMDGKLPGPDPGVQPEVMGYFTPAEVPVIADVEALLLASMPRGRMERYEIKGTRLYREAKKGNQASLQLLVHLLGLVEKHALSLFYGAVDRLGYAELTNRLGTSKGLSGDTLNTAFFSCAQAVDRYVYLTLPKEQVLWIADKGTAERRFKAGLEDLRLISQMDVNGIFNDKLNKPT